MVPHGAEVSRNEHAFLIGTHDGNLQVYFWGLLHSTGEDVLIQGVEQGHRGHVVASVLKRKPLECVSALKKNILQPQAGPAGKS